MTDIPDFPRLADRQALPEALRLLVDALPRIGWEAHPNFEGLVRFWMERHQGFRQLHGLMTADARGFLERDGGLQDWRPRLSHYGGMFLQSLHGHHMIEDHEYFPMLAGLEPRLAGGFEMLERDHQELDVLLRDFADRANAVLRLAVGDGREAAAGFAGVIDRLGGFLDRHLTDEEDLVVPVILKTGGIG
jgi:iron-sulfur cluster repair protein YtfE (RIC family)